MGDNILFNKQIISNQIFNPNTPPVCLDYKQTVIAQYANSPKLLILINHFSDRMKTCPFFNDFYNNIWNIDTANGYGLNIWGVIVGVNRTIKTYTGFFWGYNETTILLTRPYHDETGYNDTLTVYSDQRTARGMFRDFQELEGEVTFEDGSFRKLILAKAHANISDYSIQDINFILMDLFGGNGREVYIKDNLDMTMTIVFNWAPSTDEVAIIQNAGLLFRPSGVDLDVDFQIKT